MASKIPYNMICECISGDETALKAVLKHYEPMIVELSKRTIRTGEDEVIQIIDEDIRAFIESELALAIWVNMTSPGRHRITQIRKQNNYLHTP